MVQKNESKQKLNIGSDFIIESYKIPTLFVTNFAEHRKTGCAGNKSQTHQSPDEKIREE